MVSSECPGFTELSAYMDDEVSAEESAELEAHLSICPVCSNQAAELRGLSHTMRVSPAFIPPIDVVEQVRWRVAPRTVSEQRQHAVFGLLPLALAASIILGLGVTLGSRLANPIPLADLSTAARLAPFGAVPPGNVCLNYPTCYSR